ncbi:hypothetical protein TALC_00013 [Thermoplasmatales archaeon BRNA1]|nr:hypothetical protein TALC_00013 [Thermoplasmatales archaeon BRNA1]
MKSLEERLEEFAEDPAKKAKLFKWTIIIAYSMLMLGIVIILAVLFNERF